MIKYGRKDKIINFVDYLVDSHELERRKLVYPHSFYQRANFVGKNFLYYSNDTMANCYYDARLRDSEYDRLESVMHMSQAKFFGSAFATHFTVLAYMTYFFRYRRLTKLQTVAVGTLYFYAFSAINSSLYKIFVDKDVISTARTMGLEQHIQPCGTKKARGLNFGV